MREQINGIKENVEIDLQKLLLSYLRRWWLIVACAVVAALGTLFVTANYVTPMYRTGVTVYVNNSRSDQVIEYLSHSNLEAAKQLVNTYVNIIKSNTVLEKVVDDASLNYSVDEIRNMMSTEQVSETEIFRVYITHADRFVATEVANAIAHVAPTEIEAFVEGSSAKIVDYAKVPTSRFSPDYEKNTILGAVIGAVVALLYLTIRFLMDVCIRDSEDLEMLFEIPILGQIPNFGSGEPRKRSYGYETRAAKAAARPKSPEAAVSAEQVPTAEVPREVEEAPATEEPKADVPVTEEPKEEEKVKEEKKPKEDKKAKNSKNAKNAKGSKKNAKNSKKSKSKGKGKAK